MNRSVEIRNIAVAMACCLAAASCSTDEDAGTALPDGQYPMTFTAAVDGLTATRGNTAEGGWDVTDRIAVQVGTGIGAEVKQYKPTGGGSSVTLIGEANNYFYWQSSSETKSVTAWYCGDESTATGGKHVTTLPASWTVQANQSGIETGSASSNYQHGDFLYAAKEISFNDRATTPLVFYHQTAKVIVNIKNAEVADVAAKISGVVIGYDNNLALSGTYTAPATGNTAGTWEPVTSSDMGTVIPKDITDPDGDYLKSYAALVIPQDMSRKKFIAVTLSDNKTYYYTPKEGEANLTAGNVHTYDITVKYDHLEAVSVSVPAGNAWGTDGGADRVTSKEVIKGYSASDLKIGDYYYSDGTWSDGGYRKYANGTTEVLNIPPLTDAARWVIGIVYSTDVSRIGAAATKNLTDRSITPHGLVMALTNASEDCRWGDNNLDENENGSDEEPFKENTDQLKKQYNNVDGYGETQWILNNHSSSLQNTYTAFYAAKYYGTEASSTSQYAAPANTTGWFIPSMGQWWDILSNLGGIDLRSYRENTSPSTTIPGVVTTVVGNMNKYLTRISGATAFTSTWFLSSSEYSSTGACYVIFSSNGGLYLDYVGKYNGGLKVRCSFAF